MGIITSLFEKRDFSSQSWITDWLRGIDVGASTSSGVPISPENAVTYSAVLACGRIISEGIASIPLFVYKRLKEGKEKAANHPLYYLLHSQPNNEMTSFMFREVMVWHLLFWGNFYAEINYSNGGDVKALWPLLPWKMQVLRNSKNELMYKYLLPDGTHKNIPKSHMLHIPGMSFDGIVGKSLISVARESIGLGLALEEFGARFFGQGTQFGGFIEHPRTLSVPALSNLRASLKEKYTGISNAHKIFILEEGMKFSKNIIPPNDAQFIEARKFQVIEIARIFNVNLDKLKDLDRSTYSNIEQQSIDHVVGTLRPWCVRIEQALLVNLFTMPERKLYFAEHLLDGLLRGDIASRYAAYAVAKQWGWMNADDIRELENQNPLPDGIGKKYWQPLNMIDASKADVVVNDDSQDDDQDNNQDDNQDKQDGQDNQQNNIKKNELRAIRSATFKSRIANSYRGLFEEATTRIIKLERTDILKAAESIFGKRNIKLLNFLDFIEDYYKDKYDEISKRIKPVISTYSKVLYEAVVDEIGSTIDDEKLEKFMDEYAEAFNKRYISTSKSRLTDSANNALVNELDPYGQIEATFNDWEQTRPQTVSLKETIKIAGAVSLFTFAAAGIVRMMWVNTGSKSCPFCESLSGTIVGVEQTFASKDQQMEAEGKQPLSFSSNISHPPLHGGCICMITPA